VVCHRNADVDAYLSAFALSNLIRRISPKAVVDIATPGGMTLLTRRLARLFPHRVVEESRARYDLFVAVDVGQTELLGSWLEKVRESGAYAVLVDHHPMHRDSVYDRSIVDTNATSTAEVVHRIFKELGISIDQKTAQALLIALLFDSQHLAIAHADTLRAALDLVERGGRLEYARRVLRVEPEYGEVIAKLKGAKRLQIMRLGPWVVVTSRVGSFQAQVARSLITLGADVAVVAGRVDQETRASLRSSARFAQSTKIHLGTRVAGVVAEGGNGHGGGHPTAASLSSRLDEEDVERGCIAQISKLLKVKPVKVE